jgi:hypothetical protein
VTSPTVIGPAHVTRWVRPKQFDGPSSLS